MSCVLQLMYVWCLNTMYVFKGGGKKRKGDFGDALGEFSWAVQHKDSWEQLSSSWKFSLVDDSFQPLSVVGVLCFGFFSVCVCFWGCVWVGYFCLCFCSMSSFFFLPCLTSQFLEVAPTDCVGDPGSRASSGRLKDLNSVFLCPNHLATGQAGLILYLPPALPLGRNSILFSVKVYSSCCSSGEQIWSDELALSHGKAILFKKFLSKPESARWASSQSSGWCMICRLGTVLGCQHPLTWGWLQSKSPVPEIHPFSCFLIQWDQKRKGWW